MRTETGSLLKILLSLARSQSAVLLAAIVFAQCGEAAELAGHLLPFTRAEVHSILRHGPWPVAWRHDPSNRVSGRRAAVEFGREIFFDPRFSANGKVSCATCHVPERNWTDGRKVAAGLEEVERNTPGLANVRLNRWFGWDGAGDSLWAQSIRPLLDAREFGAAESGIAQAIRADRELACRYERVYGAHSLAASDEAVLVGVGKTLAAFQETLASGRTPFDDFRDALARGDRKAASRYPEDAQRGLRIFVGRGNCSLCHAGPNFTHGEFHDIGIPGPGTIEPGRYQGIKLMQASRFNLLRQYNDDRAAATALSARHVELAVRNIGEFKVPSLRNIALTAPYMHNGRFATLNEVVRHYSELDPNRLHTGGHEYNADGTLAAPQVETILKPLKLSAQEIDDVVAFLGTLTERGARTLHETPRRVAKCR